MSFKHAETPFHSVFGSGTFHCFSFGPHEEDNILALVAGPAREPPLVRVQSACYTAEIFRSSDCDCHAQLKLSLERIHGEGGILLYLLCDGRGAGLLTKVRGLALGAREGLDTAEAYEELGIAPDPRRYGSAAEVLKALRVSQLELLTNNPRKIKGLRSEGLEVEREPLLIPPTNASLPYLRAKQHKLGHLLDLGSEGDIDDSA